MKEIITIRQVAQLCAVAPSTVQYWERKGYLKSFKTLGGHRRFEKSLVLEFLEKRGRKLTRESAKSIIEAGSRQNRRSEDRIPVEFSINAQFTNGQHEETPLTGRILDISTKGFGIVLTGHHIDKSVFRSFFSKYRTLKAWLKDQVGYIKNPLEGNIQNFVINHDSVRIGLAFSR